MSPSVIAAAKAQVPVTIRSGMVVCRVGVSEVTPRIVIVGVPSPSISAPMAMRKLPRSTTSGSRAALSRIVTPLARTAAVMMFSVAPTLGKSREMLAPWSPSGAFAIT